MRLFRLTRKPGSGQEERELVLDTDAETNSETEDGSPQEDDSPDPSLLDTFHEAKNEGWESTPASELTDIPIQDLLSDLVGVSRRLGRTPRTRAEPGCDEARDVSAEPDEEGDAAEPNSSLDPQLAGPTPTGYRRYTLHAFFLSLALAAAIGGGLIGAERLARTEPSAGPPAQSPAGDTGRPVVVATVPGVAMTQEGQMETAAPPTLDAAPEPSLEPTPGLQPAYFLYTVEHGDSVISIARTFGISPDYILWNNPNVIDDPNLVLVGDELLIPSVDGIIYHVKPGDTLSSIAASYHIDVESILSFVPNGLTSPDEDIGGMVLILPGAVPPP